MAWQNVGGSSVQFLFADHMLDTDRRELHRGSEAISVEPQVLDLLICLVQNRNRVVTKDDLIASVWRGRIVSEATLTSRIYAARKAVGDSGQGQRLIRTIARKGLRFVGDVQTQSDCDQSVVAADLLSSDESREPVHAQPCRCPSGRRLPCCRSTTCAAIRRRSIFQTASAKTSSRRCPSCAGSS